MNGNQQAVVWVIGIVGFFVTASWFGFLYFTLRDRNEDQLNILAHRRDVAKREEK